MPVAVIAEPENDLCMEMNKEYEAPANAPSVLSMFALLTGLALVAGAVIALVFTVSQVFK